MPRSAIGVVAFAAVLALSSSFAAGSPQAADTALAKVVVPTNWHLPSTSTTSTTSTTTTPPTTSPTTTTTTTTTIANGGCTDPGGQCLPVTPAGYKAVCLDDFTVNAPVGSWADPTGTGNAVVYTGDHGCHWTSYPDGWPSTYTGGQPGYEPSQVLSVHDGMLDFFLHNVNGLPAGANPSPILSNTGSQYQTYGMYEARLRITNAMPDFYVAWLLWPQNDANWQSAESDFPEANLADSQVCFYAHYGGGGAQDSNCKTIDFTQWHTYSQVWGPGSRSYYIDGQLLGTSTNQVWSQPERWQLQTEPSGHNDGDSGHLYLDWVAVYAPG